MTTKLDKTKTSSLFNTLKDGQFISRNSPHKTQQNLFKYVENNSDELVEFFSYIDIEIKIRDGYCYFASQDNKEQKLKTIIEFLDILSFFLDFNPLFGVGFRFRINEIEERIKDDITLKIKLDKLKSLHGDTLHTNIASLVSKLERRGFISLEDEYMQKYIVLNSCEYLMEFFNKIEIKE